MRSFSAFAALMAASGSIATPLKPRSPKVVDVYEYTTKVDVVTVAAPIVTDWIIDEVVVTITAPVDVVTVTQSQAPQFTSIVRQDVYVSQKPVTKTVTTTVQRSPAATTPVAQAPVYNAPVQIASSPQAPSPSNAQPNINDADHADTHTDHKTKTPEAASPHPTTSQAPPPPALKPSTASAPQPSPPKTSTTSAPAPPPPTTTAKPSPASDNLPTHTIIYDLQPNDPTYTDLVLYSHNVHRQNHTKTHDLVYNSTLEAFAKEKAMSCIWDEDLPADANAAHVGMNMAEGTFIGAANITSIISDMWYNNEYDIFPGFGIANPDMSKFDQWGHFTQVIWRSTDSVGCWSSSCDRNDGVANQIGSGFFTVCMYWPPANFPGQYAEQVGRPEGHPIVTGV